MKLPIRWPHLFLIIFLGLISACASVRYGQDFKSGTDFSQLKTYTWRSSSVNIPNTKATLLQSIVDAQLQSQGYQYATENADLLLDLQLISRISQGSNTSIGLGIGLPIGRHGSISLGSGQTLGKGKQEGVMIIDITDARTNSLIWRGQAEAIPLIYFTLQSEPKLKDVVQKNLAQFPPH